MSIEELVPRSVSIANSLPYDTSKHSKYVHEHSEQIIREINLAMQKAKREYLIMQFRSYQEAKKVCLD